MTPGVARVYAARGIGPALAFGQAVTRTLRTGTEGPRALGGLGIRGGGVCGPGLGSAG